MEPASTKPTTATPAFPIEKVRDAFPALQREVHGRPVAYLDSGASAQKPRVVLDVMGNFAVSEYANVHRGVHFLSAAATDRYEAARRTVQKFLNAAREDEIVFTKGGTEAINLVASSYGLSLEAGDEIVLSQMEHHANIVPWHFLRERKGVVLKFAPVTDDGRLDVEAYRALLGPKTRMVALSHMSNVLGTINPVRVVADAAHAAGAVVVADGAQLVPHAPLSVQDLDRALSGFSRLKQATARSIIAFYDARRQGGAVRAAG